MFCEARPRTWARITRLTPLWEQITTILRSLAFISLARKRRTRFLNAAKLSPPGNATWIGWVIQSSYSIWLRLSDLFVGSSLKFAEIDLLQFWDYSGLNPHALAENQGAFKGPLAGTAIESICSKPTQYLALFANLFTTFVGQFDIELAVAPSCRIGIRTTMPEQKEPQRTIRG